MPHPDDRDPTRPQPRQGGDGPTGGDQPTPRGPDDAADDPTRATTPDQTEQMAPATGAGQPWEGVAQPRADAPSQPPPPGEGDPHEQGLDDDEPPKRPGRDTAFALGGLIVGVIIAFIVIALGSGDPVDEPAAPDEELEARVEALEAELEERDAQISDLEAQLAEAEAAAGERDEDIAAQQEALDERATGLDQRAEQLDQREAALDEREAALEEREAEADEPADDPDDPDDPTDELVEDAETIIDEILERIRGLFGGS